MLRCVGCGSTNASRGWAQHPYCADCFQRVWLGNQEAYEHWMRTEHDGMHAKQAGEIVFALIAMLLIAGVVVWSYVYNATTPDYAEFFVR